MDYSIVKTSLKFEIPRLTEALHSVIDRVGWGIGQVSLTCHPDDSSLPVEKLSHGDPTRRSATNGKLVRKENWYNHFIPAFEDTYFYDVWNTLNQVIPGGVFRFRLFRLGFRECHSIHRDYGCRYHIPIITNDAAYIFMYEADSYPPSSGDLRVDDMKAYRLPADGSAYKMSTGAYYHTAMNGGRDERIHLVCSADD